MTDKQIYAIANELVPSMVGRQVEVMRTYEKLRRNPWIKEELPQYATVEISLTFREIGVSVSGVITEAQYHKICQGIQEAT